MKKTCLWCDSLMTVPPSLQARNKTFCSQACRTAHLASPQRFLSLVDVRGKAECWEWLGARNAAGYGTISGKYAHRVSAQLFGVLVNEAMYVCHSCDNPGCVNPNHLFEGSAKANSDDMCIKKRHCHGERKPFAKLTEAQAKEVRLAAGPQREIAKAYGVSQTLVSLIKAGKHWPHLANQ
jgi:hypothetical protein